jgi:hypothetical protein
MTGGSGATAPREAPGGSHDGADRADEVASTQDVRAANLRLHIDIEDHSFVIARHRKPLHNSRAHVENHAIRDGDQARRHRAAVSALARPFRRSRDGPCRETERRRRFGGLRATRKPIVKLKFRHPPRMSEIHDMPRHSSKRPMTDVLSASARIVSDGG